MVKLWIVATFEIRDELYYVYKLSTKWDGNGYRGYNDVFILSWDNISYVVYIRSG